MLVMESSPSSGIVVVLDPAALLRPESRFHSSVIGLMLCRLNAGCSSSGSKGGGGTMMVPADKMEMLEMEETGRMEEAGRDKIRAGFRGGIGTIGIGSSACTACSYRKAIRSVSSRNGVTLTVGPPALYRTLANLCGAIAYAVGDFGADLVGAWMFWWWPVSPIWMAI